MQRDGPWVVGGYSALVLTVSGLAPAQSSVRRALDRRELAEGPAGSSTWIVSPARRSPPHTMTPITLRRMSPRCSLRSSTSGLRPGSSIEMKGRATRVR
jgi:hypothetical protein